MNKSNEPTNTIERNMPFILSFVVTHECNLNCVYCYESTRDKQKITAEQVKAIIAEYLNKEELKNVQIDFFGGEPWLKFALIKEVCEWVWSKEWKNSYKFFTTTNGTLVHGEIQEWLRQNRGRFWCGLSLDGTKETHDKNRCNSFDKIDKDFFLECWPTQPVKMTISKDSVANLSHDIIYLQQLGFKVDGTNFAEGIDWSDKKYIAIVSRELEKLVAFYLEHPEYEVPPILNMALHYCESPKNTKKWCGNGWNMAIYDIDGRKYPCQFFTPMTIEAEKFAEVKDIDFTDDTLFLDTYCVENCYFHNICSTCYGANFLSTGKVNVKDKSKCNLLKVRAYYAAALLANKILRNTDTSVDTNTIALQIRAIEKIKEICERELELK